MSYRQDILYNGHVLPNILYRPAHFRLDSSLFGGGAAHYEHREMLWSTGKNFWKGAFCRCCGAQLQAAGKFIVGCNRQHFNLPSVRIAARTPVALTRATARALGKFVAIAKDAVNHVMLEEPVLSISRWGMSMACTFLDHPGVPPDNNHAERQIRPAVIVRKNSYANDSEEGAETQAVLMS